VAFGRNVICIVRRPPADTTTVGCSTRRHALREGLLISSIDEAAGRALAKRFIVGITPDGVRTVHIHTPGYGTVSARVIHDVFIRADYVPRGPEKITLVPTER